MKKFIVTGVLLAVAVIVIGQSMVAFTSFTVTNGDSAVPAALTNAHIKVTSATLRGYKDRTTANTGIVYVGCNSTNDTQLFPIASGGEIVIGPLPGGTKIDLSTIYIDVATVGDGVIVTYY